MKLFLVLALIISFSAFAAPKKTKPVPPKLSWGYEVYPENEKDYQCVKAIVLGTPSLDTRDVYIAVKMTEVLCSAEIPVKDEKKKTVSRTFICQDRKRPGKDLVQQTVKCGDGIPADYKVMKVKGQDCNSDKKCTSKVVQLRVFCTNH